MPFFIFCNFYYTFMSFSSALDYSKAFSFYLSKSCITQAYCFFFSQSTVFCFTFFFGCVFCLAAFLPFFSLDSTVTQNSHGMVAICSLIQILQYITQIINFFLATFDGGVFHYSGYIILYSYCFTHLQPQYVKSKYRKNGGFFYDICSHGNSTFMDEPCKNIWHLDPMYHKIWHTIQQHDDLFNEYCPYTIWNSMVAQ